MVVLLSVTVGFNVLLATVNVLEMFSIVPAGFVTGETVLDGASDAGGAAPAVEPVLITAG